MLRPVIFGSTLAFGKEAARLTRPMRQDFAVKVDALRLSERRPRVNCRKPSS
jgi:hypothetical protein